MSITRLALLRESAIVDRERWLCRSPDRLTRLSQTLFGADQVQNGQFLLDAVMLLGKVLPSKTWLRAASEKDVQLRRVMMDAYVSLCRGGNL
jgi:hypothetical protein